MPLWMRSFLCFEAALTNPSMLPRRCSPIPVQLPTLKSGTVIFDQSALRRRQNSESRFWLAQFHNMLLLKALGL
ncbi:hypothetical protein D3C83_84040 [compost metagenome]